MSASLRPAVLRRMIARRVAACPSSEWCAARSRPIDGASPSVPFPPARSRTRSCYRDVLAITKAPEMLARLESRHCTSRRGSPAFSPETLLSDEKDPRRAEYLQGRIYGICNLYLFKDTARQASTSRSSQKLLRRSILAA